MTRVCKKRKTRYKNYFGKLIYSLIFEFLSVVICKEAINPHFFEKKMLEKKCLRKDVFFFIR